MADTPAREALGQYRPAVCRTLDRREDGLLELLEAAVLAGSETLARLSLAPTFRRGWASARTR